MNNPIEDYKKLWEWLKNPIDKNYEAIPEPLRILATLILALFCMTIIAFFMCLITGEIKL
jgi:hypothetical protein